MQIESAVQLLGPNTHLIQNGSLAEEARTVHAAEGLFVRVNPQMLREMRLLAEALATLRAGIRPGLDVYAAVLQQRRLLLELLVADGAAHVERHIRRPHADVLQHLGQYLLAC